MILVIWWRHSKSKMADAHLRNENSHLHTKFDRNLITHGWNMEIKVFSKWRPSAILNFRKLLYSHVNYICMWFFISDPNFALIGQYLAEIQPKYNFQYGVRPPSWSCKISIFLSKLHPRNRNMHQCTKFDGNRIIHGWDMEIKLFSKWRPSPILSFRKLSFWSRDLYLCVILYRLSKFRINRPIRRRDIAKKQFSIWHPSAILDLLWRHHIASENCTLCSQLCVKFSRHWVAYFLKYLVFHVSAFWLEISYFVLNFDDFGWKIGKNVKIKYSNPRKAYPWRKTRLLGVERWRFICRCDL